MYCWVDNNSRRQNLSPYPNLISTIVILLFKFITFITSGYQIHYFWPIIFSLGLVRLIPPTYIIKYLLLVFGKKIF